MPDFNLQKSGLKEGMQIVYNKKTLCIHFEDSAGNRYLFDGTDNKFYAGQISEKAFLSIIRLFSAIAGLGVELFAKESDGKEVLRFKFTEP